MSKQTLNIGVTINDGTGDTLRQAGTKINDMFAEIYTQFGDGTNLNTATGIPSVSADPIPALGGNLDLNNNSIVGVGNVNITGALSVTGDITTSSGNFNAANINVSADLDVGDDLDVGGVGYFNQLTVTDTFNAANIATPGTLTVGEDGYFFGKITSNGSGSIIRFNHATFDDFFNPTNTSTYLNPLTYKGGLAYADDTNKVYFAGDSGWQTLAREDSPSLFGVPTTSDQSVGTRVSDGTDQIANSRYVRAVADELYTEIDLKAPIDSPSFTGIPLTPDQTTGTRASDGTYQLANSRYVREVADEIYTEVDLKAYIDSPVFTGNPQAPTTATADRDESIATTRYVKNNLDSYATLESPALTGTPTTPTASQGTNNTQIANTQFVTTAVGALANSINNLLTGYATLSSPTFTGSPRVPTAPVNDNSTIIANTAWVQREFGYANVPMWGGARKYVSYSAPSSGTGNDGDIWFQLEN
jgi:hypothetical protein